MAVRVEPEAAAPSERPSAGDGDGDAAAAGPPESRVGALRRHLARPWWPPAVLSLALGLWRVGTPGAWADEMATWGVARAPWSEVFPLFRDRDAFIAPYYVLIRAWATVFGTSDTALRMPSVLAMAAACGLAAHLGARLVSTRAGLVGGLLLALAPAASRFAQEQRMYALVMLCAVVATLALDRALERPSWRRFAVYAGAVTLVGWFHVLALGLLAAHACAVAALSWWRRREGGRALGLRWLAAALAALLLNAPLLVAAYVQRGYAAWIPPVTWADLPDLFDLVGDPALGAIAVGLALAARARRPAVAILAAWAVVPIVVLLAVSQVTPLFYDRYLLYALPAWFLLAGAALARAPAGQIGLVVAVFAVVGLPAQRDIRGPEGHGQATRAAAAIITAGYRPGDAIVYGLPDLVGSWYARDLVARYVPADRRPRDALAVRPQRVGGRVLAEECADPEPCLGVAPRVWVLRNGVLPDALGGMPEAKQRPLRERYEQVEFHQLPAVTLALWVRRPG